MTDLGEFNPLSINNRGEIAGARVRDGEDVEIDPLIFRPGKGMTLLPRPRSMPVGIASGISNDGRCVGVIGNRDGDFKAALWEQGKMRLLSERLSMANAINGRGQVVGMARRNGRSEAVLWSEGQEVFLSDVASRSEGYLLTASSINERGVIAGTGMQRNSIFGYVLTPK